MLAPLIAADGGLNVVEVWRYSGVYRGPPSGWRSKHSAMTGSVARRLREVGN